MAKSRAQRKAERRAREAEARAKGEQGESQAQHDTQVPKSGDIAEIEAVEAGMAAGAPEGDLETPDAPKGLSSKEEKRKQKQSERNQKAEQKKREDQQLTKRKKQATAQQRKRGGVIGFLASCVAELKRVQWPDRDTLLQATAVVVVFVFVAAVYLGVIDLIVNWVVQRIL
ncbi:MAG: preprotein translocase subunit SecE [Thermoleophilia bacterium]|nr:preprotein translocase subunit SecE [Thermoleophilia bacterium]